MAAKTSAKKAAKKKATKTAKKSATKSATKSSTTAKKDAATKATKKATKKKPAEKAKSGFSSLAVNMGHVFSLRPRVGTSFKADDFRAAKQQLATESYKDSGDAARAVVEKTLELSRGDSNPLRNKHHKRF
jgi:GH24 family phage-related lysozyme (muramidase)